MGSPVISVPVDRELQSKAIGRYAVSKSFTHFDEVLLLFPALLTLAQAASSAQPQRPSKTPSTVVEIQGRVIQLPHLPESVQQAHSEYGRIKLQLEQDLVDLERNLQELYMDPDQSEPDDHRRIRWKLWGQPADWIRPRKPIFDCHGGSCPTGRRKFDDYSFDNADQRPKGSISFEVLDALCRLPKRVRAEIE